MATELAEGNRNVDVEFTGGLEIYFNDERKHTIRIRDVQNVKEGPATLANLIEYLSNHLILQDKKEVFVLGDNVRPGILVLINDTDWELEGSTGYELKPNDHILFVSTLHGG